MLRRLMLIGITSAWLFTCPNAHGEPKTNEYGLVTNGPDQRQNKINQMVTDCARIAGIRDKIYAKEMLILTTCIDIKTGAYKQSR